MPDQTFTETILERSMRGVRLRHLTAREVREAERLATSKLKDDAKGVGATFGIEFMNELLLRSLSAVTTEMIEPIYEKDARTGLDVLDEDGEPILDVDAMLDSVSFEGHPEAWTPLVYKDLIKATGPTSMDEVLGDPSEYQLVRALVSDIHIGDRRKKGDRTLGKRVSSSGTR